VSCIYIKVVLQGKKGDERTEKSTIVYMAKSRDLRTGRWEHHKRKYTGKTAYYITFDLHLLRLEVRREP